MEEEKRAHFRWVNGREPGCPVGNAMWKDVDDGILKRQ